jgi:sulfhydrogenase subunit delta
LHRRIALKYLGIEIAKPKIGVFDFTGCEGCELQLANKEGPLVDFLALIEVVNFREVSSHRGDDYDIALVEGCISRDDEVERLKKIRDKAKVLVALGSCASFGGVNALKNRFPMEDVVREVYGDNPVDTAPARPVHDVVSVDLKIPGCPVSKEEVEKIVVGIITGAEYKFPRYPVCVECKQKMNTCVFELGKICLGPITRAGCGACCPTAKVGCLGCRGPAEDANFQSLMDIMQEHGFTMAQMKTSMGFFNSMSGAVKK